MDGNNGHPAASLVLSVENVHGDGCGIPPGIVKQKNDSTYTGYFENAYGEQWLVRIDRQSKTGVLRGGDVGWEEEFPIRDNQLDADLILSADEFLWLSVCWAAATGGVLTCPAMERFQELLAGQMHDLR